MAGADDFSVRKAVLLLPAISQKFDRALQASDRQLLGVLVNR
jgi:hypothetical protein